MTHKIPKGQTNVSIDTVPSRLVFSLRMPDDFAERLREAKDLSLQLRLSLRDPSQNMLVVNHGQISLPLTRIEEGQSVDAMRWNNHDGELRIVGSVKEKLLAKQELQLSTIAQVREASEAAERVRHARRILALEDDYGSMPGKKKFTQTPISRAKKPVIRKLTPPLFSNSSHTSVSDLESHDSWSATDGPLAGKGTVNGVIVVPEKPKDFTSNRRSVMRQLISRPPAALSRSPAPPTDSRDASDQYHQLEEEFGKRYQEYLSLNAWIDKRLAVFAELRGRLSASTSHIPDRQLVFHLVVEEKRLKKDTIFEEKLEQLEEACAALIMIKARAKEIVRQQHPKTSDPVKTDQLEP